MTVLLNTLYVTTQGAWLHKDHETLVVEHEKQRKLVMPFHHLASVVCFGQVSVSPWLMHACAEAGIAISFLSENGRFLARVEGEPSGNVLLRREQFRRADTEGGRSALGKCFVAGKLANSIALLRRAARESESEDASARLGEAANRIGVTLSRIPGMQQLDAVRGLEGEGAATYFGVFRDMIRIDDPELTFERRSRYPPRDRINSLLSFLYVLLQSDCAAALSTVGLDPAVGFLHVDRPGRLSLPLDLMEEFRSVLADRLALALINRRQIRASDFQVSEVGAVRLTDTARREVLVAWQKRKQEVIRHPFTDSQAPLGVVVHLQARLLARTIRGEMDVYPPFHMK